ncbi:MAG: LacI family DNA-binding transcriptional regulator [Capsulimonadales bacterium]|nr:LacI family DNA-binding transcriptional regulator [Capsulimonadales bacterium]
MAGRKNVTIHDVAARVGVSPMTVSNVLSQNTARRKHVSEETRARVLEAVRLLKYRPNANAISLRRKRTNIIGLFGGYGYVNAENAFLATILGGLQAACDRYEKDLLVHGTFRGGAVSDIFSEVADGRIDGLILYTSRNHPLVEMLAESALSVVAITDAVPFFPSVLVDDRLGGRMQADHLAERGHHRVVAITSKSAAVMRSVSDRLEGFLERATSYGMEVLIRAVAHSGNAPHITEADLDWLSLPAEIRPTAAVCWNDLTAYDLLGCCFHMGVRVPEELAIVGFDGVMSSRGIYRRLTTVRAPWSEVASTAVKVLIDVMEGSDVPQETVLQGQFIIGDTT